MAMITVKAAPGRVVRDPVSKKVILESGALVSDANSYWQRRLRDGDVLIVKAAPAVTEAAKASA